MTDHPAGSPRRAGLLSAFVHASMLRTAPESPRLAGFVLDAFAGPAPQPESDLDALTAREREVLQHIARGYMYKEIALRLDISPKTV